MTAWQTTARPLLYEPKGGSAFIVQGTLSRPSDGELVGGLDEQQSVFVAPWAPFAAAGATSPDKFDNVTDPGPAAHLDVVARWNFFSGQDFDLCGVNSAAASNPISAGYKFAVLDTAVGAWVKGSVTGPSGAGLPGFDYVADPPGVTIVGAANQQIIFYPPDSRTYSVHNVEVIYNGSGPEFVRCEVTG